MVNECSDPKAQFWMDARTQEFQEYWESSAALARSVLVYNTGRSKGQLIHLLKQKPMLAVPDVLVSEPSAALTGRPSRGQGRAGRCQRCTRQAALTLLLLMSLLLLLHPAGDGRRHEKWVAGGCAAAWPCMFAQQLPCQQSQCPNSTLHRRRHCCPPCSLVPA